MKTGILKKIKKLNWIPAPRPLTELSIISVLELCIYIIVFGATIMLYQRWTDVAVREIDIECESLHPIPNHRVGEAGHLYKKVKNIGCKIYIDIPFSKVDTVGHLNNYSLKLFKLPNENNMSSGIYESQCFDQVLNTFIDVTDSLDYLSRWEYQLFYNKLTMTRDNFSLWLPNYMNSRDVDFVTSSDDSSVTVPVISTYTRKNFNTFTHKNETFVPAYQDIEISKREKYGVMSKPSWYDEYDVSQFYFRVNVKSRSVPSINLNFTIRGANNYTFIDGKPDSLVGQQLYYSFTKDSLKSDSDSLMINQTLLIHVQSKELEILQQSRIFGVTALLSALITVFLAFLIIWICRLVYKRWNKNLLKKQEKPVAENSNESILNDENQEDPLSSVNSAKSPGPEMAHSQDYPKTIKKKKKH